MIYFLQSKKCVRSTDRVTNQHDIMVKIATKSIPKARFKGRFADLNAFRTDPPEHMRKCKEKFGDTFHLDLIFQKAMVTSNPEVIRHVLQTNNKNYIKDLAYRKLKLALGNGLLMNEGESWMAQRRLAQPAFYKKRLEGLFDTMVETTERFIADFEQHRGNTSSINITSEMNAVASDVALDTLLGGNRYGDNIDIQETISRAQKYIVGRIRYPWKTPMAYINGRHRRFQNDLNRFDKIIFDTIDQHRKRDMSDENHLLSMLLEARDEDTGEQMNNQQLRDELITIYVAGHETSANALSWTWYLLTQHPDIYQRLKDEVRSTLGNRRPTLADLRALPFARQVMEEAMRLYPPAWTMGREALNDDEADGYPISKGGMVFISICNMHRDERYWENPEKFDPDRFSPERTKERHRGVYIPFGLGPRMCIGNNFALMEIQLIIMMMVQHFDFELDTAHPVVPEALITLRPKHGIKVFVK